MMITTYFGFTCFVSTDATSQTPAALWHKCAEMSKARHDTETKKESSMQMRYLGAWKGYETRKWSRKNSDASTARSTCSKDVTQLKCRFKTVYTCRFVYTDTCKFPYCRLFHNT